MARGSLSARLRSLSDGDSFEIDTPNLAFRATEPGHYRVDVDPASGTTRVTVLTGAGAAYGASGQTVMLAGGQQASFREKDLTRVSSHESPPLDNFDRWADERNRREDQSVAARYVPRDITGYQQLDPHGQWAQDATLGAIWYPQVDAKWAPYRFGQWEWVAPWGWTWLDDAPWAFATSHYGRWSRIDARWAWVPGRLAAKPVYAPALVAFVGQGDSLAWFPLAPGEAWQPPYKASLTHTGGINRGALAATGERGPLAHQRSVHALTVIASGDFHRGKPAQVSWLRLALNELSSAQADAAAAHAAAHRCRGRAARTRSSTRAPGPCGSCQVAAPLAAPSVQVTAKAPAAVPVPAPVPAARPVHLAQAPAPPAVRPAKPAAAPVAAAPKAVQPRGAQAPPRPDARVEAARAQAVRDKALRLEAARRTEQAQKAQLARRPSRPGAPNWRNAKQMQGASPQRRWKRGPAMAMAQVQAQIQKQAQVKREEQMRRVAQARREEQCAGKTWHARKRAPSGWSRRAARPTAKRIRCANSRRSAKTAPSARRWRSGRPVTGIERGARHRSASRPVSTHGSASSRPRARSSAGTSSCGSRPGSARGSRQRRTGATCRRNGSAFRSCRRACSSRCRWCA